jgi:medium-chain acyl-[acyl-carrier-protein] hydrolase
MGVADLVTSVVFVINNLERRYFMEFRKLLPLYLVKVPKDIDKIRLFCFPFAGGGASIYSQWQKTFSNHTSVYPIQLPGRENRINEEPIDDINVLVENISEELAPYLDRPFVFFGHSLGAKIAYEVCRYIKSIWGINPCHFIVSASRAPHIPEENPIHHLTDDLFMKALYRFSGTPEEILNRKELMNIFLPRLRTDFTLDEEYVYCEDKPLECPITAFVGREDKEAVKEDVELWNVHTNKEFDIQMFSGGHFFIRTEKEKVLDSISEIIQRYIN